MRVGDLGPRCSHAPVLDRTDGWHRSPAPRQCGPRPPTRPDPTSHSVAARVRLHRWRCWTIPAVHRPTRDPSPTCGTARWVASAVSAAPAAGRSGSPATGRTSTPPPSSLSSSPPPLPTPQPPGPRTFTQHTTMEADGSTPACGSTDNRQPPMRQPAYQCPGRGGSSGSEGVSGSDSNCVARSVKVRAVGERR